MSVPSAESMAITIDLYQALIAVAAVVAISAALWWAMTKMVFRRFDVAFAEHLKANDVARDVENRLSRIEIQITHLPTLVDVDKLRERIEHVSGQLDSAADRIDSTVKLLQHQMELLNSFLLQRDK